MQVPSFSVRIARKSDIPRIKEIFASARRFMAENGNPQWSDGYPYDVVIDEGVTGGNFRVAESDGVVAAVWSVYESDEEYDEIDGMWLTDVNGRNANYIAAHTLAVSENFRGKGLARAALNSAAEEAVSLRKNSLRMDTHVKNLPMQRLLTDLGFSMCGRIKARGGSGFLCFEKVL